MFCPRVFFFLRSSVTVFQKCLFLSREKKNQLKLFRAARRKGDSDCVPSSNHTRIHRQDLERVEERINTAIESQHTPREREREKNIYASRIQKAAMTDSSIFSPSLIFEVIKACVCALCWCRKFSVPYRRERGLQRDGETSESAQV